MKMAMAISRQNNANLGACAILVSKNLVLVVVFVL